MKEWPLWSLWAHLVGFSLRRRHLKHEPLKFKLFSSATLPSLPWFVPCNSSVPFPSRLLLRRQSPKSVVVFFVISFAVSTYLHLLCCVSTTFPTSSPCLFAAALFREAREHQWLLLFFATLVLRVLYNFGFATLVLYGQIAIVGFQDEWYNLTVIWYWNV